MARFFASHECGPTCQALGLRPPGALPATVIKAPPVSVPEAVPIFAEPVSENPDEPCPPVPELPPPWARDFDVHSGVKSTRYGSGVDALILAQVFRCQAVSCGRRFGPMCWRHHCRACGNVFCGKCTKGRMALPWTPPGERERVCDGCVHRMTHWVGAGTRRPPPTAPPAPPDFERAAPQFEK